VSRVGSLQISRQAGSQETCLLTKFDQRILRGAGTMTLEASQLTHSFNRRFSRSFLACRSHRRPRLGPALLHVNGQAGAGDPVIP
jgi:hypothetical protein